MKKPCSKNRFHFNKTPLALGVLAALQGVPEEAAAVPVPAGPEFRVNTYIPNGQVLPAVAMDADGDFVVVWASPRWMIGGANWNIYAQRYLKTGAKAGGEFRVNATIANAQYIPRVAMDADGDFVVVWAGYGQPGGDSYDIYARRYDKNGAAIGGEFRVNTTTADVQYFPVVAMDADGDFVVAWSGYGQPGGDSYDIYARRYSKTGVPVGSEFRVNTYTTSAQYYPGVGMDADGDIVVVWQSYGQDTPDSYGVYGQRYNASGIPQSSEFRVNSTIIDWQYYPATAVAMDNNGDFVVVWTSYAQDGGLGGIYAQRYAANGATEGSEFKVNDTTANMQNYPAVAMDAAGDFVVTWTSFGQDGDNYGVYGRQYAANGTPQSSEFQVNTTTASSQTLPAVAMDAYGDFVVTWQSYGQDTPNSWGIYAQRYNLN